MAAAGQEIRETDLVHLTQVRFLDPRLTSSDDTRDVEREPANRGDRELGLEEQRRIARRRAFTVVANEPRAIRKLHHGPHYVKARHAGHPLDSSETCQIDVAVLVAKGRCDRRLADTSPEIWRIRPRAGANIFRRWILVIAGKLDAGRPAPVSRDRSRRRLFLVTGHALRVRIVELQLETWIRDCGRCHSRLGDEVRRCIGWTIALPPLFTQK